MRRTLIAVAALAVLLAGCGGSGTQPGGFTYENVLTVYSDLPLQGPQGSLMRSIDDGEILALEQAHARGEDRDVSIALLNDAGHGGWTEQTTGDAAREAGQDLDAIAYIGDFDSAATAVSLDITNENNILQVSPASPYAGLTDVSRDPTEPDRYYPDGRRTFARLAPSSSVEAVAATRLMRSQHVERLYTLDDGERFDGAIAGTVAADWVAAGGRIAGSSRLGTIAASVARIAAARPAALFVGAAPSARIARLWAAVHARLPSLKLFAPSTLATAPFIARIAPEAGTTYVTSPILPLSQYPASAQAVLRAYRRAFGTAPTAWSLYGYEAMASVLAAVREAHASPDRRLVVVHDYFALGERHSVLGDYRIDVRGDSSLRTFAVYRVGGGGQLLYVRRISG
ncbi:MAG TPA: ABC transporter substrate-binding protein [Solirubrobacteraceae bacterium]|nr:ABC transporter substrate-binding protein [Solirubrobacteraceae bacterium]